MNPDNTSPRGASYVIWTPVSAGSYQITPKDLYSVPAFTARKTTRHVMWGLGRCGLLFEVAEAAFFPTLSKRATQRESREIFG
jgi:hypothetical protein